MTEAPGSTPLENGEVQTKTAFLRYRAHLEMDHQILSGCREDLLRKVKSAWRVTKRTIVLDANVARQETLRLPRGSKPSQRDLVSTRSRPSASLFGKRVTPRFCHSIAPAWASHAASKSVGPAVGG
jgi:hypothetical protein